MGKANNRRKPVSQMTVQDPPQKKAYSPLVSAGCWCLQSLAPRLFGAPDHKALRHLGDHPHVFYKSYIL